MRVNHTKKEREKRDRHFFRTTAWLPKECRFPLKKRQPPFFAPNAETTGPCASCEFNTACPFLMRPRAALPCERPATEPKARLLRARTKLAPRGKIALIGERTILSMCSPDPHWKEE